MNTIKDIKIRNHKLLAEYWKQVLLYVCYWYLTVNTHQIVLMSYVIFLKFILENLLWNEWQEVWIDVGIDQDTPLTIFKILINFWLVQSNC